MTIKKGDPVYVSPQSCSKCKCQFFVQIDDNIEFYKDEMDNVKCEKCYSFDTIIHTYNNVWKPVNRMHPRHIAIRNPKVKFIKNLYDINKKYVSKEIILHDARMLMRANENMFKKHFKSSVEFEDEVSNIYRTLSMTFSFIVKIKEYDDKISLERKKDKKRKRQGISKRKNRGFS